MVTLDNYEEYMLLEADGELDEAGRAALYAFLAQHPELQKEMDAYMATRLVPDTTMVFENKDSLLKSEPKKAIALGNWWMYAAAAAVVAFVVVFMNRSHQGDDIQEPTLAKTEIPAAPQTNTAPSVNDTNKETSAPASDKSLHSKPADPIAYENKKQHQQKQIIKTPIVKQQPQQVQVAHQQPKPVETIKEPVENKPVIQQQPAIQKPEYVAVETPKPPIEQVTVPQGNKEGKSMLASLPIIEHKREGLNDLADAVDAKLEKIKNIANEIKGTDVKFKIGKKELFVVRL